MVEEESSYKAISIRGPKMVGNEGVVINILDPYTSQEGVVINIPVPYTSPLSACENDSFVVFHWFAVYAVKP